MNKLLTNSIEYYTVNFVLYDINSFLALVTVLQRINTITLTASSFTVRSYPKRITMSNICGYHVPPPSCAIQGRSGEKDTAFTFDLWLGLWFAWHDGFFAYTKGLYSSTLFFFNLSFRLFKVAESFSLVIHG